MELLPLERAHWAGLLEAAADPRIWTYVLGGPRNTPESLEAALRRLEEEQERGVTLPFTVVSPVGSGRPVGQTQYMEIRREHRRAEIGGTWYAPSLWGTGVNVEAKYLLLRHAFDHEGLERVEFKTDERNVRSQRALEKIGATREGVFRRHSITWDGFVRNSVYYSVIASEWPSVRARLETMLDALGRGPSPPGPAPRDASRDPP